MAMSASGRPSGISHGGQEGHSTPGGGKTELSLNHGNSKQEENFLFGEGSGQLPFPSLSLSIL